MKQKLSVLNYQSTNTPQFTESNNKKFIEMGVDNHYPHYLESLFASSSINGAVVKGCAFAVEFLTTRITFLYTIIL